MKKIYLIGIGMGTREGMTVRAEQIINRCDLLLGADRMLAALGQCRAKTVSAYRPEEIRAHLQSGEWENAGILLSGDVGFYSGAKKLMGALSEYELELVPGISTVSALCAKLGLSWDEAALASLHGRQMNVIGMTDRSRYTFCLLGGAGKIDGISALAQKLLYYRFDNVILHIGERIGYPDEKIYHMSPKEADAAEFASPVSVVIENPAPRACVFPEIGDEEFIRGNVPMTKAEVRGLAIQKLGLTKNAVLYDIGAGTGSVAVQAALCFPELDVYAVEYKDEAADLIRENQRKFRADNVTVVVGKAPAALAALPVPTHAFIGGSAGQLREILRLLWEKNPRTVVVVSAVTLETFSETLALAKEYGVEPQVVQISVARAKQAGAYHLMTAQNPVSIIKLVKMEEAYV